LIKNRIFLLKSEAITVYGTGILYGGKKKILSIVKMLSQNENFIILCYAMKKSITSVLTFLAIFILLQRVKIGSQSPG